MDKIKSILYKYVHKNSYRFSSVSYFSIRNEINIGKLSWKSEHQHKEMWQSKQVVKDALENKVLPLRDKSLCNQRFSFF